MEPQQQHPNEDSGKESSFLCRRSSTRSSSTLANRAWKAGYYSLSSPSATGVPTVGQIGNCGYGSMTMEKIFRDCSISACGSRTNGASEFLSHNFGWVCIDPAYSSSSFFDQRKFINGTLEEEQEDDEEETATPQIETLHLFPMHGDDINGFCNNNKPDSDDCSYSGWYGSGEGYTGSRASLELSLDSYI
ncbi:hypothetical protein PTKIN_Ptkin08bG0196200 [Pterospermum kingtungense]